MLGLRSSLLLSSLSRVSMGAAAQRRRAFGISSAVCKAAAAASTTKAPKTKAPKAKEPKVLKVPKAKKAPKKEPKKPKDPKLLTPEMKAALPPKKPNSPYMRYYVSRLAEFKETNSAPVGGLLAAQTIAREAGEAWRNMTLSEKAKYAVSEQEMADYRKAQLEWERTIDRETLAAINKRRHAKGMSRIRAPGGAKRPLSSYALFTKDYLHKHLASDAAPEEKSGPALMKKAAETWRALSESEKKVYEDQAAVSRAEYYAREGREAPKKITLEA